MFEYRSVSLKEQKIEAADISSLLSNLLDNAVEAAENCTDPYVKLDIFVHNVYLVFRVENSVCNAVRSDTQRIGSTKEDRSLHGCGMDIIREIAEKYGGSFTWKSDNDRFIATVLMRG